MPVTRCLAALALLVLPWPAFGGQKPQAEAGTDVVTAFVRRRVQTLLLDAGATEVAKQVVDRIDPSKDRATSGIISVDKSDLGRPGGTDTLELEVDLGYGNRDSDGFYDDGRSRPIMAAAGTINLYAARAAFLGVSPYNTVFYNDNRGWRASTFSVQIDKADAQPSKLYYQAEVMVLDLRNPRRKSNWNAIQAIAPVLVAYDDIEPELRSDVAALLEQNHAGMTAEEVIEQRRVTAIDEAEIAEVILDNLGRIPERKKELRPLVDRIQKRPQLSLLVNQEFQDLGDTTTIVEADYDQGVGRGLFVGVNVGYQHVAHRTGDPSENGVEATIGTHRDGHFPLTFWTKDDTEVEFDLGGTWTTNSSPSYSVNGTVTFPLTQGISLPLNVGWETNAGPDSRSHWSVRAGLSIDPLALVKNVQRVVGRRGR